VSDPEDQNITPEDQRILDQLDSLGPESATQGSPEAEAMEAVVSLVHGLAEIEPRAEVKGGLMQRVADSAAPAAPAVAHGEVLPFATPEVDSGRLAQLERQARWYLPIAAALAIALIGLTGWHFKQLEEQRATIAALSVQVESMERDGIELALARNRLNEMQSQMRLLTTSGAEFCVLRPHGKTPTHPQATATMVISSDRNRWFLAAEGLEPCAKGRSYQLWFITESTPVRVASFDGTAEGGRVELSGSHDALPDDVRAVAVTLEVEADPAAPSQPILLADEAMTLL
jgi:hypothetical protein